MAWSSSLRRVEARGNDYATVGAMAPEVGHSLTMPYLISLITQNKGQIEILFFIALILIVAIGLVRDLMENGGRSSAGHMVVHWGTIFGVGSIIIVALFQGIGSIPSL